MRIGLIVPQFSEVVPWRRELFVDSYPPSTVIFIHTTDVALAFDLASLLEACLPISFSSEKTSRRLSMK